MGIGTWTRNFRFDSLTILCCLLSSATFIFWMHAVEGGIHIATVAFLLVTPIAFFCLGDALLRWLKFPIRAAHPFPFAFLLGSVVAALSLFLIHLMLPLPLRLTFAGLFLASLACFAVAPTRDAEIAPQGSKWKVVVGVLLALAASSLWTQDLRPAENQDGASVVIHPYVDSVIFAEFVGQLHDDTTLVRLGDPDMAGVHLPIYHYASFLLPASLEAWSPGTSAFDSTVAFWIPFSFVLVGLSAFCLAAEWLGDFAGIAAVLAVLLIPSPPLYWLPLYYLSFHWLLAVSPGLAYGIAGAATALVLLAGAQRSNRLLLFAAGLGLMVATVFLKAHIALVGVPLAAAWVIAVKKGWTTRTRVLLFLGAAVVGYGALRVLDHLKIGPNILPNGTHGSFVNMIPSYLNMIRPGFWPHVFMHHVFFTHIGYPVTLGVVAVGSEFGIWFLFWMAIAAKCIVKRRCSPFDLLSMFAVPIYLFCTFISPPNTRGGFADEMWHRPFVWLYFLLAALAGAHIASWLEKTMKDRSQLGAAGMAVLVAILLLVPFREGKSIQHWIQIGSLTHARMDTGFIDCSDYVRTHGEQTDIVQSQVSSNYPFLSAFTEKRAYLGRVPGFWKESFNGTPAMTESQRRGDVLASMRAAQSASDLQRFVKMTGIRWYIARPDEALAWPKNLLEHPAFASSGFRVYDLATAPSMQ